MPGFDGPIQVGEAWFDGKARNRHRRAVDPGKTPVVAVVDNATGKATATPVHEVGEYVRADGVTTNSAESYWALGPDTPAPESYGL